MPKVSVIIPAYNSMNYLPETMASLFAQTFDDFEAIIVNDGSDDDIETWVAQNLKDRRVKLVSQDNQGAPVARNTGIANAKGEYIAFLDADDLWEATKLEKQVQILDQNPEVGLVYTWVTYINEQGTSSGRIVKNQVEGDVWVRIVQRNIIDCGSVPLVRHQCLETLGAFDPSLSSGQDWDLWIRIASDYQFAAIKEPLVYYRQHQNNKSKNYHKKIQNFQRIIEKAFQHAPYELLYLRNRSYGYINLCIAWKSLQSSDQDYKQASYFRRQALLHYPQLFFNIEYIRLSIAIMLMSCFGPGGYRKFLSLFYTMRRRANLILLNFTPN